MKMRLTSWSLKTSVYFTVCDGTEKAVRIAQSRVDSILIDSYTFYLNPFIHDRGRHVYFVCFV